MGLPIFSLFHNPLVAISQFFLHAFILFNPSVPDQNAWGEGGNSICIKQLSCYPLASRLIHACYVDLRRCVLKCNWFFAYFRFLDNKSLLACKFKVPKVIAGEIR